MSEPFDRLAELRQELSALRERVERLEEPPRPADEGVVVPERAEGAPGPEPGGRGLPPVEAPGPGVLAYDGAVEFGGKQLRIQSRRPVAAAFSAEPETVARIFAALGSPHRVLMLRALCDGPRSGQQLEEAAGLSSTGQLYHHLKELLAAGLVTQPARSLYELRPAAVISVCVALVLAADLAAGGSAPGAPVAGGRGEPWPDDV